jgi:hypothetical protein
VCLFREPDAGNLPVRFDEREQETELRQTGLRRAMRKQPNSRRDAKATAPSRLYSRLHSPSCSPMLNEFQGSRVTRCPVWRRAGVPQECDLSCVMRFVLTDVEPLAIVVGRTPRPVFIDGHKPGVIALAELRQRLRPGSLEDVQIIVPVVTFVRFPAKVSQIHRSGCQLPSFEGLRVSHHASTQQKPAKHKTAAQDFV